MKLSLVCLPKVNVVFKQLSIFGWKLAFLWKWVKSIKSKGKWCWQPKDPLRHPFKSLKKHCAALITIDDNSCYFIVNNFQRGASSKLLLYWWYAALFWCAEWRTCVLCKLM